MNLSCRKIYSGRFFRSTTPRSPRTGRPTAGTSFIQLGHPTPSYGCSHSGAGAVANPVRLIDSPADVMQGTFSPDGRMIAYTSNESGTWEVYAQTFPLSDRRWLVSINGGYEPRWSADGHEIYYLAKDRK